MENKNKPYMPETCGKCDYVGNYTLGPYKRDPHYCCELIWQLCKQDYRVNPETLDEKCPFRNEKFKEACAEICSQF